MSRFFKIFLIKGKYFKVFIWEDIKKTSQDVYETIKGKTENVFELLKAYFYETTVLFFKENSLDTESNMTVVELEKQIFASLEEYSKNNADVQVMLEEEFKETMEKLKQYN